MNFGSIDAAASLARQQQCLLQPESWSPVNEGFVGDPWLSIMLMLCHILHSISQWPVLKYFINTNQLRPAQSVLVMSSAGPHVSAINSRDVDPHLSSGLLFSPNRLSNYRFEPVL
jgi:hypothetical protein